MANNIAFNFTGDIVSISIPTSVGKMKRGEAGVYHAIGEIERSDGQGVPDKDSKYVVGLAALEERLDPKNENQRKADYENQLKADRDPKAPQAFELWSMDGTLNAVPRYLIPTNKVYNDAVQLLRWADFANHLGGKPPSNVNPAYARFLLKPSEVLKKKITVYFTPSDNPVCGVNLAKLEAIIAANKDKFVDWPQYKVLEFSAAQKLGLKAISANFFAFYVTWMLPNDYTALWKEWDVNSLPLTFPAAGGVPPQTFKDIDAKLKKGSRILDGTPIHITSDKIRAATGNREGQTVTIMGQSATTVANNLWGPNSSTTRMGQSKSEWLHRSACIFGGLDQQVSLTTSNDPGNLVFGTWECNTEMIRVENMVTEATRRRKDDDKKANYVGMLTTTNKPSGSVSRRELSLNDSSVDIPAWFEKTKYSWLCFELDYVYTMLPQSSPLGCALNAKTAFEPWSLYVPLHIEPRLDVMVLTSLKDDRDPAKISKTASASPSTSYRLNSGAVSNPFPSIPPLPLPDLDLQTAQILAWRAAMAGLPSLELPGLVISHPTVAQPQHGPSVGRAAHPVIVGRGATDTVADDAPSGQPAASDTNDDESHRSSSYR